MKIIVTEHHTSLAVLSRWDKIKKGWPFYYVWPFKQALIYWRTERLGKNLTKAFQQAVRKAKENNGN